MIDDEDLKARIDNDIAWAEHVADMPDDVLVPYVESWLIDWYAMQLKVIVDQKVNKLKGILSDPNTIFKRDDRVKSFLHFVRHQKVRLQ